MKKQFDELIENLNKEQDKYYEIYNIQEYNPEIINYTDGVIAGLDIAIYLTE